jgi:hypothetical protein
MRLLRSNIHISKRTFSIKNSLAPIHLFHTENKNHNNEQVKLCNINNEIMNINTKLHDISYNLHTINSKIEGIDNYIFTKFFLWNALQFPLILFLL